MTSEHSEIRVAVLGAGVVGACTAISLRKAGFSVTLIDPEPPGGRHGASFGNAGWLSPASVVPMSMPGLWRKVPKMLLDPLGPLAIRPHYLSRLAPWLVRFIYAGATVARVEATARALCALLEDSVEMHRDYAHEAGVDHLIKSEGLIYAYVDRASFEADFLAWRLRKENGVVWRELEGDAVRDLVPFLAERYRFAAYIPAGGHCFDPGAYVAALVAAAIDLGVSVIQSAAQGFSISNRRLKAIYLTDGEAPFDRAVICAGIHSKLLARAAGDHASLESERGYHVVVQDTLASQTIPVQTSDGRIGVTPMAQGIRAAGQVELCSPRAPPNWRRADIVLKTLIHCFPRLSVTSDASRAGQWMGHRPSTPDGLPMIGFASASADIVHAFGHGHVGLASAPRTAGMVCALLKGSRTDVPLEPYSPQRFNGYWPRSANAV